jgi:radical SAM superfamily enzyme YgiQ (UPF0313 family)
MKVLLSHGYFLHEDAKEQALMRPYPPLGLLYIAGHLRDAGHDVRVYDSTFGSIGALYGTLRAERPQCLGLYVNLMTRANVVRIMKQVRQDPELQHLPIILGGPETRAHAQRFLDFGATACVVGEGERTMSDLITAFDAGRTDLHDIPGIVWRDTQGTVHINPERDKLKDLAGLSLPARDLIDMHAYLDAWRNRHGHSTINVSTMRGCPYTCRWCSRGVYGLSYRRRPVHQVIDELAAIQQQYSPDRIWFVDDVFTVSQKWLQEFAEGLEQRGLRIQYECITRADRMNEPVIELLKRSGCVQVWVGAESGSQSVIDAMDRRVDVQRVRDMIKAARKAGIGTGTFIMLGYPGEREDDILQTVEHLKKSSPDVFTITVAYPISGTELYAQVANELERPIPWEQGSDRELDFPRAYRKPYYGHAVRYVVNEVAWHKAQQRGIPITPRAVQHKLRALSGRAGMLLWRSLS